jgi:putative PIN family toxin of toxin-antitoxin system
VIRAVLDANTVVSGFPASGGTMGELIDRWQAGRFRLVVSQHILAELGRAWTKPYWRARFAQTQIDQALALMQQDAEVTPITATVAGVATHPEDDIVLATAVSARVDYLATGDKQLQALGRYQGVIILSPRDFLTLLEQQEDETEAQNFESDEVEGETEEN